MALSIFLSACAPATAGPTPIPEDFLPTAIAMTARVIQASLPAPAAFTPSPTGTETPTPAPYTPAPTSTATLGPDQDPADVQILSPGEMSKLVSPILLRIFVKPGHRDQVLIELLGEDGRLLVRELKRVYPQANGVAYLALDIPFEIRATAELGRLQITTYDDESRMQAFSSVHVLLLSVGESAITPSSSMTERCLLDAPKLGQSISGGEVVVEGEMLPFNRTQVILELVDKEGKSIASRILDLNGEGPQVFTTTLPYSLRDTAWVQLVVRQYDDRIEGLRYLYSREILLSP